MKKRMKKLIRWSMVIMIPVAIMLNWEHLNPFTRLAVVASLFVFIPLAFYVLSVIIEEKTKEITSEQKREEKKALEEQIDKIYFEERM